MCLLVFAWNAHPDYRLLVAANRDEFHGRPTRKLQRWPDQPGIVAGRDLQAGGTWLAIHQDGRFATVTNYRENPVTPRKAQSRGGLVTEFITGSRSASEYSASIDGDLYTGFSLLTCDGQELVYVSNRGDQSTALADGVYGLSNASLETPWPKLLRSKNALLALLQANHVNETSLMRLMADRDTASAADVDHGELPFHLARALTAPFIVTPDYGTRCTTTLLWSYDGRIALTERRFDAKGTTIGTERVLVHTKSRK